MGDVTTGHVDGNTVNHPKHYNVHPSGVECIEIVEWYPFNVGNAIKYLWRMNEKGGLEDLKKAAWYIQREIDLQERVTGASATDVSSTGTHT